MSDPEKAYYLYCLAPAGEPLTFNQPGVFVWPGEDIRAVLSEARRNEFCGAEAEARLQDLAWLAPRACRHASVVEQAMAASPVLPASFATLFSSLATLDRWIRGHREPIAAYFALAGGRREWAVTGTLDRTLASRALSNQLASPERSPGKHYLQSRRAEAATRERTTEWLKQSCLAAAQELQQCAPVFRERKVCPRPDSSSPGDPLLNWAYLVEPAAEAEFRARVEAIDERYSSSGLTFRVSGPWPPYSFAPALDAETF